MSLAGIPVHYRAVLLKRAFEGPEQNCSGTVLHFRSLLPRKSDLQLRDRPRFGGFARHVPSPGYDFGFCLNPQDLVEKKAVLSTTLPAVVAGVW